MKKGILHTLLYYGICIAIYFLLTFFLEEPRHSPGLNHMFALLIMFTSCIIILKNIANIISKKNKPYNLGALIINAIVIGGLVVKFPHWM